MTDIVERLRRGEHWPQAAADEIERLRAEVETWVGKAKTAIWSDSEECKLLAADNERLRAALRDIIADSYSVYAIQVARAALGKEETHD